MKHSNSILLHCDRRWEVSFLIAFLGAISGAIAPIHCANASTVNGSWPTPTIDRWMYPFNATPGTRPVISTFGSMPGAPEFDSRDGQYIIAYDTTSQVTAGLGASNYTVTSARLTIEFANDLVIAYDPTPDGWKTFLAASDPEYQADTDAGQSIDLFGCGFRNGFTSATFLENSPYATPNNPMASGVRNAYAMSFNSVGNSIDVSNNPRERFEPRRFATGQIAGLPAGSLIALHTPMYFDLDLADSTVQGYLRSALNDGKLFLVVSSLTFVEQQGGNFPAFYAKENALVQFQLAHAAALQLTVSIGPSCAPADINCDNLVNGLDLAYVLSGWGSPGLGDINHDGITDGVDLTTLLSGWLQ